jgi:hypothetical protein
MGFSLFFESALRPQSDPRLDHPSVRDRFLGVYHTLRFRAPFLSKTPDNLLQFNSGPVAQVDRAAVS